MLIRRMLRFLSFYWSAQTRHQIDSPFVFEFAERVLKRSAMPSYLSDIEIIRSSILNDHSRISLEPMGASARQKDETTVARLARHSLSRPSQQMLFNRIVAHYRPQTILELGTSFGLSSIYLQMGNPDARLISIEGRQAIFEKAQKIHERFPFPGNKPRLLLGEFADQLSHALTTLKQVDLLFIDGDHQGTSLKKYFDTCSPYLHDDSIVIVHDIYWSHDMHEAWSELSHRNKVTVAIDLFHSGLLFFRPDVVRPIHVQLINAKWKPLTWGFFR